MLDNKIMAIGFLGAALDLRPRHPQQHVEALKTPEVTRDRLQYSPRSTPVRRNSLFSRSYRNSHHAPQVMVEEKTA